MDINQLVNKIWLTLLLGVFAALPTTTYGFFVTQYSIQATTKHTKTHLLIPEHDATIKWSSEQPHKHAKAWQPRKYFAITKQQWVLLLFVVLLFIIIYIVSFAFILSIIFDSNNNVNNLFEVTILLLLLGLPFGTIVLFIV